MPRTILTLCSALALAATSACVPSSSEEADEFGENSPMAAIQTAGELVVAVPEDAAPFSSSQTKGEPESEPSPEGFVVDLAEDLAEALEVEVRYIEAASEEMGDLVAGSDPREIGDQEADLAFPLETVTFKMYKETSRLEGFDLTTPYFIAHQRILAPTDAGIQTSEDLASKTVCSFIDPAFGLAVETTAPGAIVEDAADLGECVEALGRGDVDAVVANEVDLLQMLALFGDRNPLAGDFTIVGEDLTTQGYAPYVVRGMADFSSDVFSEAQDDGRWAEAYERWIAPLTGGETREPPDVTLLEAAALYPLEESGDN